MRFELGPEVIRVARRAVRDDSAEARREGVSAAVARVGLARHAAVVGVVDVVDGDEIGVAVVVVAAGGVDQDDGGTVVGLGHEVVGCAGGVDGGSSGDVSDGAGGCYGSGGVDGCVDCHGGLVTGVDFEEGVKEPLLRGELN